MNKYGTRTGVRNLCVNNGDCSRENDRSKDGYCPRNGHLRYCDYPMYGSDISSSAGLGWGVKTLSF